MMTSHLHSHRTTDIKPEMLSGVQNGNGSPDDKYNIRGIAHVRTNRKDDIFMQRRLEQDFTLIWKWGQGTCLLTKHALRWAYSRYFPPACCLLRFAAFFNLCPPDTLGPNILSVQLSVYSNLYLRVWHSQVSLLKLLPSDRVPSSFEKQLQLS